MNVRPFLLLIPILPFVGVLNAEDGDQRRYIHESQIPGGFRQWRTSTDGKISVSLRPEKTTYTADEGIILRCFIRNLSDKPITLLSPFGDEDYAITSGLGILGPDGEVEYVGPQKDYVLGSGSFLELPPQSATEGALTIPKDRFPLLGKEGLYVIDYRYVSRGYPSQPAPANFWTGGIDAHPVSVLVK